MDNVNFNRNGDVNECTSRGICSKSPSVKAMQEIIFIFFAQIAYYILKLKDLGGHNDKIIFKFINDIASLNTANSVNEIQLFEILSNNYNLLKELENTYINYCKTQNLKPDTINLSVVIDSDLTLAKSISIGEKLFIQNYRKYNSLQINLVEILFLLIINTCDNLIRLCDYGHTHEKYYKTILSALNIINNQKYDNQAIKSEINLISETNNSILKNISEKFSEQFGDIASVEVTQSTRPGKAILVSGSSFFDLYNILEFTKDKDVDIYTHGNLLLAHSFYELRKYKNLIGHYENVSGTCIMDYGTFPGAILLTKGEKNINEYLYRGRLFSNNYLVNSGIIKLQNNDYSPVIEAAILTKGFNTGKNKLSVKVGYDENKLTDKINIIAQKFNDGLISHLYIMGFNFSPLNQNKFLEILKKNEYAICFYEIPVEKNIMSINISNCYPLHVAILNKLFEKIKVKDNITFVYPICDIETISYIIYLTKLGFNDIYLANNYSTVINPVVFDTFTSELDIKVL